MRLCDFFLKGLRYIYRGVTRKVFIPQDYELSRDISNQWIYNLLTSKSPVMISRFGTGELGIMVNYLACHDDRPIISKCLSFITDDYGLPWWDLLYLNSMKINMGIFPPNVPMLEKFAELYLKECSLIDLLGSLGHAEKLMPLNSCCKKVHFESLYPFFVEKPWTRALKGKKVLVVHPFIYSIQNQYNKRDLLFDNKDILPDFELILYKPIVSNAEAEVPFETWFEALKLMKDDITKINFDIAILGCGAYGLPLASHVKRLGKKAVHLGGGTQLLFGIRGRRWDDEKYGHWYLPHNFDTNYSKLINEYWVRPETREIPKGAQKVEDACYW